jgi:DNA-directed RNA polymerase specialized sigma24 family protein
MNRELFASAYESLFEPAVRRAMMKGLSREEAEDVVQNFFLNLYEKNDELVLQQKSLFWQFLDWRIIDEKRRIKAKLKKDKKMRQKLEWLDKIIEE